MIDFAKMFEALTGDAPFCWQRRLHGLFCTGQLPAALDLPTGVGKTSVMPIWLIARAGGASVPRRLVYVVDRRAVVDQASDIARKLGDTLARADEGALAAVRAGLGLRGEATLAVSTLRGQLADNRAWLADPTAPAIVVGTIDMIGSRLLFSGYGVSRSMRPCHAGLLGADTLIVLDEAHLVPPFEALVRAIENGNDRLKAPAPVPAFRVLSLSATGRAVAGAFRLNDEEVAEAPVKQRIEAAKQLRIERIDAGKLVDEMAKRAVALAGERARVLVYCDRRNAAEKIAEKIKKSLSKHQKKCVELLVGQRRVREREKLRESPIYQRFLSTDHATAEGPAFLVATAAGEVGVDLSADHMICDVVAFERMVQRLGRVNRRGERTASDPALIDVFVDEKEIEAGIKRGSDGGGYTQKQIDAVLRLLGSLPSAGDGPRDASPAAMGRLRHAYKELVALATTREPLRPALDRPSVEAWAMTSLAQHPGRPDVAPWLRGWVKEEAPETTLVWRAYLPWRVDAETKEHVSLNKGDRREIEAFFAHAPPHQTEKLEVPASLAAGALVERCKKWEHSPNSPAAMILDPDLSFVRGLTVEEVANENNKKQLGELLVGKIVVLNGDLGGLNGNGLLDEAAAGPVRCLDGENADDWQGTVGYRVRKINGDSAGDESWQERHRFDLVVADTEEPPEALVVEELRGAGRTGDSNDARSTRTQLLDEHHDWAGRVARCVARELGLGAFEDMLVTAARLHDRGKDRSTWQRYAMNAPRSPALAKFAGRGNPNLLKIGEESYRHEFGSLADAEACRELQQLPADQRELALHLIASHHGDARPVIAAVDEDYPPSASAARARAVALRYARLQRHWGPWGLAWWEAIFRGIDWRASRLLDDRATPDREAA